MKIEAIREALRAYYICLVQLGSSDVIKARFKRLQEAEAELTALEADNAAKDEALRAVKECCDSSFYDEGTPGDHYTAPVCPLCGSIEDCDEDCPRHLVEAAISPPTGKVLVDRDILRKLDFALSACPVCLTGRDKAPGTTWKHKEDCKFAALLKEN